MSERTNGEILLKTKAFGGFEKTQVLAYIDKLREENQKAEVELQTKIDSVSQARDELSNSISQFESQIVTLEQKLAKKKDKIDELTGVISSINSELSQQKIAIANRDKVIENYKESHKQLTLEAEQSIGKARRYDEISSHVGQIIVEAKRTAESIVDSAKTAAESSQKDFLGVARKMSDDMSEFRSDIADIRSTIDNMTRAIAERVDAIEEAAIVFENRIANVFGVSGEISDTSSLPEETVDSDIQQNIIDEPNESVDVDILSEIQPAPNFSEVDLTAESMEDESEIIENDSYTGIDSAISAMKDMNKSDVPVADKEATTVKVTAKQEKPTNNTAYASSAVFDAKSLSNRKNGQIRTSKRNNIFGGSLFRHR